MFTLGQWIILGVLFFLELLLEYLFLSLARAKWQESQLLSVLWQLLERWHLE